MKCVIILILFQQILGCSIICALMQEYAITVKSADVGLQWETHLNAKKHFEVCFSFLILKKKK